VIRFKIEADECQTVSTTISCNIEQRMTQNNADLLRTRLKQSRKDMPVADRQRESLLLRAKLFTWLATTCTSCKDSDTPPPKVVAGFWPLSDEPDLTALFTQWHQNGVVVVLPVMQTHNQTLEFHRWQPEVPLIQAEFGVQQPPLGQPYSPDVVLVPTLGFTPDADRLGYGKGFYDRTFAQLIDSGHKPTTIGVAWDHANLHDLDPAYAAAAHDHPLDAIVTATRWYPEPARYQQA